MINKNRVADDLHWILSASMVIDSCSATLPVLQVLFYIYTFVIILIEVPYGAPNRAIESLPKEVVLRESKIPNAGFGVVSLTFIKR